MKNQVLDRLLEHTENHLEHFLDVFSAQVINKEASLFLGTGISMNSGYPSWKSLLSSCAAELKLDLNNETDLYAVAQFYANKHSDSELRRIVSKKINTLQGTNSLLESLFDVNFNSIWTTNYDKLIERGLDNRFKQHNVIFSDKNLASIDKHDKINIYKMNGDISDPINMVVTKHDFEHYTKKHPLFLTFLKKELVANTFLFVGYSFSDHMILACLSSINEFLGSSSNSHYALMLVDENVDMRFEYHVQDLKKRYGINCIFATKANLTDIIAKLNQRIKEKNIFISGSYDEVPSGVISMADSLSHELVTKLYNNKYRITTGIGKKLGTLITGYAYQYLAENNISNRSKYLSMRPFPFHLNLDNDKKIKYRNIMQHDCSTAIFMFGHSRTTTQEGSIEKTGHYSKGTYQEFEIAKQLGNTIIPIGSTGYESEVIWKEVKSNINKYYYLSKKIDILMNEKNPKVLSNVILSILDDVSRYTRIK